jgi:dihydrofolate reductase
MADQPNAMQDRGLQLQLELWLDRRPISGRLRTHKGAEETFEGWLGFTDALRRLHEQPAMSETGIEPAASADAAGFGNTQKEGNAMRKITANLFISLDGVVEAPERWNFPYFNEEMGAAVGAQLATVDTMLVGRKTYETFAGAWSKREAAGGEDAGTAKTLGDTRKIVVSNQKLELTWRNSEQLEGDLIEAVIALKTEPGGDIAISGSISVIRQLLNAGLLDELHLLVDPIAVRTGTRLFDESDTTMPLRLIKSNVFTTGVLHLVYGPVESAPNGNYRTAVKAMAQAGQQG